LVVLCEILNQKKQKKLWPQITLFLHDIQCREKPKFFMVRMAIPIANLGNKKKEEKRPPFFQLNQFKKKTSP
jgi:hypothetical protein